MTRLALLLVLLAAPAWAQDRVVLDGTECVTTHPKKGDIWTTCRKGEQVVEVGQREDTHGNRYHLTKSRKWWALGRKVEDAEHIDPTRFPNERDPVAPPAEAVAFDSPPLADVPARVQHSVGIAYTARAEAAAGGALAIQALCVNSVAIAQQTYDNSLVPITLVLKYCRRTSFVETPSNIGEDLWRVTKPGDGYADEVHPWREEFRVDITTVFGEGYAASGACGVGYMGPNAPNAFNIVDRSCATGRPSYGHEVGHNQGLRHDPITECGQPTCAGYNYGSDFGGGLGTMMSYRGTRVRYESSPLVRHPNGYLTGIANQRDNVRRLIETMGQVALFRQDNIRRPARPVGGRVVPSQED